MVQAGAIVSIPDVHTGAFAHGLEPLEDGDVARPVFIRGRALGLGGRRTLGLGRREVSGQIDVPDTFGAASQNGAFLDTIAELAGVSFGP